MKKENLLKFYQNYRLYVFPTIVALSSLLLIALIIFPQASKLISNQRDEGELINKSRFMETKVSALEGYNNEDLSHKLEVALQAYPANKDFEVAVGLLQQLALGSGFNLASVSLGSSGKASAGADSYELKLEMVGGKSNLPILLKNLESAPRLIRVNSIDLASNNDLQAINVSLVVAVLFASAPSNFGSVDSPLPDFNQKEEDLIAKLVRENVVTAQIDSVSTPKGKSNPFE